MSFRDQQSGWEKVYQWLSFPPQIEEQKPQEIIQKENI